MHLPFQKDELLDISSRRVQQAPAAIAMPDCFGFLYKLGARWHQWKRRYCVLKDASLFLYHDTEAQLAIGTAALLSLPCPVLANHLCLLVHVMFSMIIFEAQAVNLLNSYMCI